MAKLDPKNLNVGTERGRELVEHSLEELGAGRSIITDNEGFAIGGNKTLEAWAKTKEKPIEELTEKTIEIDDLPSSDTVVIKSDGSRLVVIERTDLAPGDPDRERLAILDNRTGELGLLWAPELKEAVERLEMTTSFTKQELKRAVERYRRPIEPHKLRKSLTEQRTEQLREKWKTEVGQVWQIGPHRLYIADSTGYDVGFDVKFNLLFTSPPYWLGREYEAEKNEDEIDSFIHAVAGNMADWIEPEEARIIINTSTSSIHRLDKNRPVEILPIFDKWIAALRHYDWTLRHFRIWVRNDMPYRFAGTGAAPISDMAHIKNFEHIGIFTSENPGPALKQLVEMDDAEIAAAVREMAESAEEDELEAIDIQAAISYILTFYTPDVTQRGQERVGEAWANTVTWQDIVGSAGANDHHTAAMPMEIASRFIQLYSRPEEYILDPFLGSGTTMIQAHRWERVCYGIEHSPEYAASALELVTELTGLEAKLID